MLQHPFIPSGIPTLVGNFPPQMLPASEKNEDWKHHNLDALEAVGRAQYWDNLQLRENYRIGNGEFIRYHYEDVDQNEYVSLLAAVQKKFELPSRLQHFDFTGQIINTLSGELESHPDTFRAIAEGDWINSQREAEKARMLKDYVHEQVNRNIDRQLAQMGLDPNRSDFSSAEEAQAYDQQLQEARQAMTPPEIQRYMDTKWQHVAAKWANTRMKANRKRYRTDEKFQTEFRDKMAADRCFRHFYLTGTGYTQETWNPVHTFFHKSPEVREIEKGNYVGRTFILSLSDIIDRYGHLMSGKQLEELHGQLPAQYQGGWKPKDWFGNNISYLSPDGLPYASRIPTNNPWMMTMFPQVSQTTGPGWYDELFQVSDQISNYGAYINNLYQVTEGYWKSQKKLGKLSWINPQTSLFEKVIVDESVVLPADIREVSGNLYGEEPASDWDGRPTIEYTWINEVWGGIKITPLGTATTQKPLYLNIKPLEFQGKPDGFLYECELPVVGEVFNNRNAKSQSVVDRIKPFQISHNLFMNQAVLIAEEEVLPFMMLDVNAIPNIKDWGGEDGWEKWMESIRSIRVAPVDTRPHQLQGANGGGQLPAVINLEATSRMLARYELARNMKQMGLEQLGMAPQRMADIKAHETATGVQTATQNSYVQTSSIFTRFYQYKQRVLKKDLDFAQYVECRNEDIVAAATNSDFSNAFLRLNRMDLLLAQLSVYVTDAQEERRILETIRQLGIENNTMLTRISDRVEMVSTNSVERILELLRQGEDEDRQNQQAAFEQKQAEIDQKAQLQKDQQTWESNENQLDRASEERQAYIRTFGGRNNATMGDTDNSGTPDALEYDKFNQKSQTDQAKLDLESRKQDDNRLKLLLDNQNREKDRTLKRETLAQQARLQAQKNQNARVMGDKSK
ncbi:hypothetical protein [Spirosoma terrae]|uniref:Uncharacterized protein n=1 Tax=Spirosoma terrae TaxID=1968276 RepID=A0A6L9LGI0_9BACT|nr:hypothetical protein [Spirosoma terrae]NDU95749.1 hypothetical protein [Spirosoma terrae]